MGMNPENSLSLEIQVRCRFYPKTTFWAKKAMRILQGVHEIGFTSYRRKKMWKKTSSEKKIILAYNAEEKDKSWF